MVPSRAATTPRSGQVISEADLNRIAPPVNNLFLADPENPREEGARGWHTAPRSWAVWALPTTGPGSG